MIDEKYDVIAVDPPWSYGGQADKARTARYATQLAGHQYDVVGSDAGTEVNRKTGDGIQNIAGIISIPDYAAKSSALLLWTTNPKLPFAFDLMRLWGFDYKTTLTWVKVTRSGAPMVGGLGWFFRGATEHVLFGTRGGYGIPASLRKPNVFHATRSKHSAKPQAFYDLIDECTPGQRRLDVFARIERPGWDAWGNEVAKSDVDLFGGAA